MHRDSAPPLIHTVHAHRLTMLLYRHAHSTAEIPYCSVDGTHHTGICPSDFPPSPACTPLSMSQRLIQSGVDNLDSGIGVYAGDEASYDVFAPLLDPILHEYHNVTAVCTMGQGCAGGEGCVQ